MTYCSNPLSDTEKPDCWAIFMSLPIHFFSFKYTSIVIFFISPSIFNSLKVSKVVNSDAVNSPAFGVYKICINEQLLT